MVDRNIQEQTLRYACQLELKPYHEKIMMKMVEDYYDYDVVKAYIKFLEHDHSVVYNNALPWLKPNKCLGNVFKETNGRFIVKSRLFVEMASYDVRKLLLKKYQHYMLHDIHDIGERLKYISDYCNYLRRMDNRPALWIQRNWIPNKPLPHYNRGIFVSFLRNIIGFAKFETDHLIDHLDCMMNDNTTDMKSYVKLLCSGIKRNRTYTESEKKERLEALTYYNNKCILLNR